MNGCWHQQGRRASITKTTLDRGCRSSRRKRVALGRVNRKAAIVGLTYCVLGPIGPVERAALTFRQQNSCLDYFEGDLPTSLVNFRHCGPSTLLFEPNHQTHPTQRQVDAPTTSTWRTTILQICHRFRRSHLLPLVMSQISNWRRSTAS